MARYCPECGHELTPRIIEERSRPGCARCGWVCWEDPKLVVAVIVHDKGKVLLGRRGYGDERGRWTFPAGFVDRGERVEDAALREAKEETGLSLRLKPLLCLRSETGNPVVVAVYPARAVGGSLRCNGEMTELRWFERGSVPDLAFTHDGEILDLWWSSQEDAR